MLQTPEIYLHAEIAYRRDRMITQISGTPIKRDRARWHHGRGQAALGRRKATVISQAH